MKLGLQGNLRGLSLAFSRNMVSLLAYRPSVVAHSVIGDVVRIAPNELVFITPQAQTGMKKKTP